MVSSKPAVADEIDWANYDQVVKRFPQTTSAGLIFPVKQGNFNGLFSCCGVRDRADAGMNNWIIPILRKATDPMEAPMRQREHAADLQDGIRILDYDDKGNPVGVLDVFWVNS